MKLTLEARAALYHQAFPKFPPLMVWNGRIEGALMFMGNNYKTSGYYGAYPHGYLERIMSMFPDHKRPLHLFSGSLPPGPYVRFDRLPEHADVVGDAEKLSSYFAHKSGKYQQFDLIIADPPYSQSDAEHYGVPLCSRSKVIKECLKVLAPGGFLVWLDQVWPMHKKVESPTVGVLYVREEFPELAQVAEIGMVKSTNHRVRATFIFQKVG